MNKDYQLEQLKRMLEDPRQQSGLYLIDTDLNDDEIETFIKGTSLCHYIKEKLIPTAEGNPFELLIIGLSHICNDCGINNLRNQFLIADERKRDSIVYSLLIQIMKHLCLGKKSVVHIHGKIDLLSLRLEDLYKLDAALTHHDETILVISKQKCMIIPNENITKVKSLKEPFRYRLMDNRLNKVHISYKHDDAYEDALKAILAGLEKHNIAYSIDKYDIMYRDNIDDYEKEIGVSDRVIMFVIPKYFESLDCMFEMTQMFKNGNVRDRIIPVVDMGKIPRNGDGLTRIKDYWQNEKVRKSRRISTEPGGSTYLLMEIQRIDDIIKTLDNLWLFICRTSTGSYEELIENNAAFLMEELKKTLPKVTAQIDEKFVPSKDTKPTAFREVNQFGEKSIYIENNTGSITIH